MYCVELTAGMQDPVPRDRIISAKWLIEEYNQEELESTLMYLDPRKAAIGVTSRELPQGVEGTFDLKEPIYGTEHKRMRVSDEFMKEVSLLVQDQDNERQLTCVGYDRCYSW